MQWANLDEFLNMGGYAVYVWPSFGLTALLVVLEIWRVRQQRREVLDSVRQQIESEKNET